MKKWVARRERNIGRCDDVLAWSRGLLEDVELAGMRNGNGVDLVSAHQCGTGVVVWRGYLASSSWSARG